VPGVLEPLGSLRYALTRRWKTREGVEPAVAMLPESAASTLAAIARGAPVERTSVVTAVRALLAHHGSNGKRPWVFADPLNAIDPATVGVFADALTDDGPDALFVSRLPLDARPPKPLLNRGGLEELVLPLLRTPDAKQIAEAILGETTSEEVTRRVAVLGGDTPLGVIEAARTLIAAGDLVWDASARRFSFRVGPRGGVSGIPVESLLDERIASLEATPRRILEAVCAAPSGSPSDLSRAVAAMDGISGDDLAEGIERLVVESLLSPEEPLAATSTMLRAVVVQTMPPSRISELYRFIARAMQAAAAKDAEFEKATVGFYLAEGGHEADGARALIEAGRAASLHGFPRAAVRLAAAAVQFDPSPRTRSAATMLSRSVSAAASRDSAPPLPETVVARHGGEPAKPAERTVRESALAAFRERDWDSLDRWLDMAIAEGNDRAAADRVRALALLGRGDVRGALATLGRAADSNGAPHGPRAELARAVVLVAAERPVEATRCALRALRATRETGDMQGEAASLSTLALAYRAMGRDAEAKRFEDASPA
jgi:tetratricopeptide (TPR) repeat protein